MTSHEAKAQRIINAILANCEEYHAGRLSHDDWGARQEALWRTAERQGVATKVCRSLCPPLKVA